MNWHSCYFVWLIGELCVVWDLVTSSNPLSIVLVTSASSVPACQRKHKGDDVLAIHFITGGVSRWSASILNISGCSYVLWRVLKNARFWIFGLKLLLSYLDNTMNLWMMQCSIICIVCRICYVNMMLKSIHVDYLVFSAITYFDIHSALHRHSFLITFPFF